MNQPIPIRYEANIEGHYQEIDVSNADGSIDILPCYEKELDKAIAKLNRKAKKLHCGSIQITKTEVTRTRTVRNPVTGALVSREFPYINVCIKGDVVQVAGYEFICKVEFDNGMPILLVAPGKTAPSFARETDAHCDHCNHKRNRHSVFVLRHVESGNHVQVGSTCLKDYLGYDAHNVVKGFQWLKEVREQCARGFSIPLNDYDSTEVLAVTNAVIRTYGWISRSKALTACLLPTSSVVFSYLNPTSKEDHLIKEEVGEVLPTDYAVALNTRQHIDQMQGISDYEYNLKTLNKLERMPAKRFGFWCSAVAVYNRHLQKQVQLEAVMDSNHIGTVGDRITIAATVKHVNSFDGQFGTTTLITFHDTNGNVFKWFKSGVSDIEVNTAIDVTGTVKKHGEYRNVKETVLTRCKLH